MSTEATKMTNQEQEMVHLTINNIPLAVPKGTKIMQAAQKLGIDIPHLCYHEDQRIKARCRLCSVEVAGKRRLLAACSTEVWEGMEVHTDTQIVRDTQVAILQLMLANHHKDCLSCPRNQNCDLQRLCSRFNIQHSSLPSVCKEEPRIVTNPAIVRDPSKCIRCGRCIRACKDVQGIAALTYAGRSSDIVVTTAYNKPMETTDCILCGQCSLVCPTGALVEKDDTEKVLDALQDPKKHVIVQVAPSVRVSLGDAFGMEPGAIVTGQMVTALHLLGFDKVFDTNFGADLTIMEEGTEFLDRLQHGGVLPMMTSCCPGWVYYVEKHYSDCLPHLSSTKSPMSIFGAVAKTYYPKVAGIDVKDIVTVSVMPCTAKKFEAGRPELGRDGRPDVDIVLTTRELIKLIKYVGLSFGQLPETEFDSPLGTASGAGAIFGTTGGVMEAALRTVCDKLTGKTLERLDFKEARGFKGIKECTLEMGGRTLHIAIAHTLKNAEILMEQVRKGISPYDFIEVMACPGGCIGGGGQPIGTTNAVKKKRMQALYEIDRSLPVRKSHENPVLQVLYRDFLGKPGEGKAHELLHTGYRAVPKAYPF
ncbi:NADH-dependent [FeFe] hydrogenase, group A6 [Mitsuokella multacida]|uniref:NADH-dependent [FeFe] hydrogenase, group A6 n=1 Tax=Mitsuokella multacida TaxID=52226 RepID=UPI001F349C10|nr:NADH-dependent [FeFe] hydrogenase, group A6 [Mitsuokella multacida]MCF2584958.1 iron hydrogenase small subunit [Mitsuokella multacida]